jgi:hypothetical protein
MIPEFKRIMFYNFETLGNFKRILINFDQIMTKKMSIDPSGEKITRSIFSLKSFSIRHLLYQQVRFQGYFGAASDEQIEATIQNMKICRNMAKTLTGENRIKLIIDERRTCEYKLPK